MIEWDHLARYGTAYDTRYHARRMIEWMDDDIRTQLLGCWGHLDATDTVAALRRTVDLFASSLNEQRRSATSRPSTTMGFTKRSN